jgi:hypothetical protein
VLSHFRDRNGLEVDLVLADGQGGVSGIEVKAALTVRAVGAHDVLRISSS